MPRNVEVILEKEKAKAAEKHAADENIKGKDGESAAAEAELDVEDAEGQKEPIQTADKKAETFDKFYPTTRDVFFRGIYRQTNFKLAPLLFFYTTPKVKFYYHTVSILLRYILLQT